MRALDFVKVVGVSTAMSIVVGCAATSGEAPSAPSSEAMADMECTEIESQLSDLKTASEGGSAGMFSGIIAMVSPSAAEAQREVQAQAQQAYQQARDTAEPVMEAKNCDKSML